MCAAQTANSFVLNNINVIQPDRVLSGGAIVVRDGRIAQIRDGNAIADSLPVIDGGGLYAAPGFIDIHCHGDGTHNFFKDGNKVAANLLKNGTTSVLATLGYSDMRNEDLYGQIEEYWKGRDELAKKVVVAMHLEGPYTNPKYGAQAGRGAHAPDPEVYNRILENQSDIVRFWTFAPEHMGAGDFARAAAAKGIVLAAGHTEASVEQLESMMDKNLRVATHWTNASGAPTTRYGGTREPGIDEFALYHEDILAEVIPDMEGRHVRAFMMKLLYRVKGENGVIIISDAYYASDSVQDLGEDADVHLEKRNGGLCGSRLTMHGAARNFRKATGCSLPALFKMASLNAARLFGWDHDIGSLEEGKFANILLIDNDIRIRRVWLQGEPV